MPSKTEEYLALAQRTANGLTRYNIIDLARKYNRRVRYFAYASATKCAEQVVAEEENTDK